MLARLGSILKLPLSGAIAFVLVASTFQGMGPTNASTGTASPEGPAPLATYTALPSADPDDGKFMAVAGEGLQTLAGLAVIAYVGVPAGTSSFEVGIFDGDTSDPPGHWDSRGNYPVLNYKLYKDPLKAGSTSQLVWQGTSESMVDDAWYTVTFSTDSGARAPSGNYFYRLDINWADLRSTSFNNFKIRTTGQISLKAGQEFGFDGGPQNSPPDPCVGASGNSYDGDWPWYFYVPTVLTSITFRDGDFDRVDDERGGAPPDDGGNACFVVNPSIFYTVTDPESHVYTNGNPSGNTEWEDFTIGPDPGDDVVVNYPLQPGLWKLRVQGMDAHNFCVLRASREVYSTPDPPLTVNPTPVLEPDHEKTTRQRGVTMEYGHNVTNVGAPDSFDLKATSAHAWTTRIYHDANGNGKADANESQITMTPTIGTNVSYPIVVQVDVPPSAPNKVDDNTTVLASSRNEWALQDDATDLTHVLVNRPPVPTAGGPYVGNEGSPITFTANGSSDPDGDPLQFRWDFQEDGTWDTGWSSSPWATYKWGDDWAGKARVEATDGSATATAEAAVTVKNVAPTIAFTVIPSGNEADTLLFSAHVTDPGSDDLSVAWGGDCTGWSAPRTYLNDPNVGPDPYPSPTLHPRDVWDNQTIVCGDNGVYPWSLNVGDDDGGTTTVSGTFSIANLPPSLSVSPPQQVTVDEGTLVSLTATATDAGSDDLTFAWSWAYGPIEVHPYYNDGVGPDPPNSPGGTYPFAATDASSFTYGDDGAYPVVLSVSDDDGMTISYTTTITVVNVPPTVLAAPDAAIDEGSRASFTFTFTDPGFDQPAVPTQETFTATVDWGFGPVESAPVVHVPGGPGVPTSGFVEVSHVYGDDGAYAVTVTVCDDDGGCGSATSSAFVANVAPTPSIDGAFQRHPHGLPSQEFYPLDNITFNGSAMDAGSDDLTLSWSWGDGTPDTVGATHYNDGVGPDPYLSPGGTFPSTAADSVQHAYALPGDYTVTLTATDDDGGVSATSMTIHVTSPLDLKNEAIQRIKALKMTALARGDKHFVHELDHAEEEVWESLGYKHPFRPESVAVDVAADVTVKKAGHDKVELTLGSSWESRLAAYSALRLTWANGDVTVIDLPKGWPAKDLHAHVRPWVDAWQQDVHVDSKHGKKHAPVTLAVHAHDASLGVTVSLDADRVATLAFAYEIRPWWVDGAHLDPKGGKHVFSEEKHATKLLVKHGKGTVKDLRVNVCRLDAKRWTPAERATLNAECDAIANLLVKADELLARIALADALETPVKDPKHEKHVQHEIDKSQKELAKAYKEWDEHKYDHAIDHFKHAWEHAQHAIRDAMKK